ncbi:hypothetical protein GGTG_10880 [Gaeumannomyces tritici R3-111a-1]|uniref:Uncharacterized protein n=1 Tax=Gaeumannomyces tritici (strain R3-111a-1) TaxID=644352 RepID=J3PBK8_GAET3|nr:hypothetical protein GGTG_10880 [Gaeumannomyces tritici R3-111a-1]EJT71625.1 hypothetical protein GGTG_10880 [Gaeumannomyces tritici R3-111a-1]
MIASVSCYAAWPSMVKNQASLDAMFAQHDAHDIRPTNSYACPYGPFQATTLFATLTPPRGAYPPILSAVQQRRAAQSLRPLAEAGLGALAATPANAVAEACRGVTSGRCSRLMISGDDPQLPPSPPRGTLTWAMENSARGDLVLDAESVLLSLAAPLRSPMRPRRVSPRDFLQMRRLVNSKTSRSGVSGRDGLFQVEGHGAHDSALSISPLPPAWSQRNPSSANSSDRPLSCSHGGGALQPDGSPHPRPWPGSGLDGRLAGRISAPPTKPPLYLKCHGISRIAAYPRHVRERGGGLGDMGGGREESNGPTRPEMGQTRHNMQPVGCLPDLRGWYLRPLQHDAECTAYAHVGSGERLRWSTQ